MVRIPIDWARSAQIIRTINLRVRTDNTAGIRPYQQLGFQVEGLIRREYRLKGRFYDNDVMGLLLDPLKR